jgi:hypothetical protein
MRLGAVGDTVEGRQRRRFKSSATAEGGKADDTEKETIMATTLANVQAGIAYRQTQAQIRRQMATLTAQLHTHETDAAAEGMDWAHVGHMTAILEVLERMTAAMTDAGRPHERSTR